MDWRSASFLVWGLIALFAAVLIFLAALGRAGVARNPFASLRGYLSGHRIARVTLLLGWMWLGWHFFAR